MAVYFLTFFCHRLFEALFVKKTQERKHPLFKYSHLSHKADFFKLAETEGNKTAKGTAKQKRTKPGVHSSWPPLNSVSEVSCFYLETIEQHGNHLLVLQAQNSSCLRGTGSGQNSEEQHWNSQNVLLFWGFSFFLCVCQILPVHLEVNWSSTGCKSALATG